MSLAGFSVRRPVFVTMAACIIMILGGVALTHLPVDLMPDISFPTITITTTYEDASPEEIEELITKPIETAVVAVTGVKELVTSSTEGTSSIRISFNWGTNLDAAVNDIRDRLDRVYQRLPDEADRPVVRKFDVANFPVMQIGVSTEMELLEARTFIEDNIQYRLERLPGVASADIYGGHVREVHVLFDINKVKALNIPLNQVLNVIKSSNVTTPAGNVETGRLDMRIRTPGTFISLEELGGTVVGSSGGKRIRLRDLAEVRDTIRKPTRYIRVNGQPGMYMGIMKQSGANTVSVARAVRREIERINRDTPRIKLVTLVDSSDYIIRSINNVSDSAALGGALAILVLLAFLRNIRSTIIISVSIPLSVVASFALVYFCGYTINIMTLGGLALGIGMLVDNSIVVLENITRLHDNGSDRIEAATRGAEEMTPAIIASTLTTLVVFLPLMFIKGVSGVMFREFSAVVAFSLTCSLFAAISLVPMMAARMLRPSVHHGQEGHGIGHLLMSWSSRWLELLETGYSVVLRHLLNHKFKFMGLVMLLFAGVFGLIPLLGTEFMPKTDESEVRIHLEAESGTRPELLDEINRDLDTRIQADIPELINWTARAGGSNWSSGDSNKSQYRVMLKPRDQRLRSSEEIALVVQEKLKDLPGFTVRARPGQGFFLMRMLSGNMDEKIGIDIRGYDLTVANAIANEIAAAVRKIPGVTDVRLTRDKGVPEQRVVIDRDKAADLKVSVETVADTLRTVLAGSSAGDYRERGKAYNILVKVGDADKMKLQDILDLSVRNSEGKRVVLRNLVTVEPHVGPVTIERKNQERITSLAVNIANRDMGSVVTDVQSAISSLAIPAQFTTAITGDYEEQQESFRQLIYSMLLALVLVYMVMACQFESFRDPLVVMFSTPLAAIGVILMLYLSRTTFNVQSAIGCIMLAGIVVNNAILLVDCANRLRIDEGLDVRRAVEESGRRRLRPILMTTLTTMLGLLPLAFGMGDGGEAQAPLARAVIGGLFSSTLITLVFIPALYLTVETLRRRRS